MNDISMLRTGVCTCPEMSISPVDRRRGMVRLRMPLECVGILNNVVVCMTYQLKNSYGTDTE